MYNLLSPAKIMDLKNIISPLSCPFVLDHTLQLSQIRVEIKSNIYGNAILNITTVKDKINYSHG